MRGTSMAAPQVTGAVLLAQQLARTHLGRSLTTEEFRYLLRESKTQVLDGDDESDSVHNTGEEFPGLNLISLAEAVLEYDGSFVGDGFAGRRVEGETNHVSPANGRPNRYVVELAPGQDRQGIQFGNRRSDNPQVLKGDYNNSGQVEQGDLDLVLLNWGANATPAPDGWTNDAPVGIIDQAELDQVLLNWGNTIASSPTGTFFSQPDERQAVPDGGSSWLSGDVDRDGVVDFSDFLALAAHFGKEDAEWWDGDFDQDGSVTLSDFLQLSQNFGKRLP